MKLKLSMNLALILSLFCSVAMSEVKWSSEFNLAGLSPSQNQFQIIFNKEIPYDELFLDETFLVDGSRYSLVEMTRMFKNLTPSEFGKLLFTTNSNQEAMKVIKSMSPYFTTMSDEDVAASFGAVFQTIVAGGDGTLKDLHQQIKNFGADATFNSKLLFLQILSSMTWQFYDSSKLRAPYSWDEDGRVSTEEMVQALSKYLNGNSKSTGVCFDAEFMINDFAEQLGFKGAFVLGENDSGMIHPEGILFDTSDPKHTKAILNDWSKMAVINFDTPTELTDALEKINGDHLLGRVLFDGSGHPLKLVQSSSDKIVLTTLGHQESLDLIRSILTEGKKDGSILVKNSEVMAAVEYNGYRFEVREFRSIISDFNLMYVVAVPSTPNSNGTITYQADNSVALVKEGSGQISNYYDQTTNNHIKFLIHHKSTLSTKKISLISNMLSYSMIATAEATFGLYHYDDDRIFTTGFMLPLVESRTGGTLYFLDKKKDGVEFDLTSMISFDYFAPREIAKTLTAFSTYLNAILNDAHIMGRLWVGLNKESFLVVDADYTYTNIEHKINLSIALTDNHLYKMSCSFERGFTNEQFPFFYREGNSTLDIESSFLIYESKDLTAWLTLEAEFTNQGSSLFIGAKISN